MLHAATRSSSRFLSIEGVVRCRCRRHAARPFYSASSMTTGAHAGQLRAWIGRANRRMATQGDKRWMSIGSTKIEPCGRPSSMSAHAVLVTMERGHMGLPAQNMGAGVVPTRPWTRPMRRRDKQASRCVVVASAIRCSAHRLYSQTVCEGETLWAKGTLWAKPPVGGVPRRQTASWQYW